MPAVLQLINQYAEFEAEKLHRAVGAEFQDLAHTHEGGMLVDDDTSIGRNRYFTIGEGIERIDGLVGRDTGIQVNHDFALLGGVIVDFLDLDFTFVVTLHDAVDDAARGGSVWYLANNQSFLILLTDTCTDAHLAATQAIVVVGHVHQAARREVGIECERLVLQVGDGGVDQFVEVMRQELGRQTHGDAFGALRQQERELHRQRHRLGVTVVVGARPVGGLVVEDDLFGEFGEACLDVTRGSRIVAREDVTEITLGIDEQVFLCQLHEGVTDGGIAVRVIFHRVTHDVGHLVETTVVEFVHRMQDAALHRFQAVLDGRHGAFQNDIRGIVEKPILKHAFQRNDMMLIFMSLSIFHPFQ